MTFLLTQVDHVTLSWFQMMTDVQQLLTTQLFNPALLDGETLISWLKVMDAPGMKKKDSGTSITQQPATDTQRNKSVGEEKVRYLCLTCTIHESS